VTPQRVSVNGGPLVIDGMGFRPGNQVSVGGVAAQVTSITPTEISAVAPAAANGATGDVAVTIADPITGGWTTIEAGASGGLSYDAGSGDEIGIVTAPQNAVPIGVPIPFIVRTVGGDGTTPAAGLAVTYTVTEGSALLGCGQTACTTTTGGDGQAAITVTAQNSSPAAVTASLKNGARIVAQFAGATPPAIAAVSGSLYLGAGAIFNWSPQAIVLSRGVPYAGQTVTWSASGAATVAASSTTSDTNGIAWTQVTAGPLIADASATVSACLEGGASCASFVIAGVNPETATLAADGGTEQSVGINDAVAPVGVRVVDAAGHAMAGGIVTFYETLRQWTPACAAMGPCPQGAVLAQQTVQAVSDTDGLVTLNPLTQGGVATRLTVLAVTGYAGTLNISIERHP
jgi:hypothetical protein